MTPAEAQTTPARNTVERNIPAEMWTAILNAEEEAARHMIVNRNSLRSTIIAIGERFGYEPQELVRRGIITAPRLPNPAPLKGGH